MKYRNRVLATLTGFGFGLGILFAAITLIVAFVPTTGKQLVFGSIETCLKDFFLIFDFKQYTFDIFLQNTCLIVLAIGVVISVLWLVIGLCKKHYVEILFFFLSIFCFAYLAFIFLYAQQRVFDILADPTKGAKDVMPFILSWALYLIPMGFILVAFGYDMKRVFIPKHKILFFDDRLPDEYESKYLFAETFPDTVVSTKIEYSTETNPEKEKLVKTLMASSKKRLESNEKEENTIQLRDTVGGQIHAIAFERSDVEELIRLPNVEEISENVQTAELLPFMRPGFVPIVDEEEVEEEVVYEIPPILLRKDEDKKEEVFEIPPILLKKDVEEEVEIPAILLTERELKEKGIKIEKEVYEIPPILLKKDEEAPKEKEEVFEIPPILLRKDEEEEVEEIPPFLLTESELKEKGIEKDSEVEVKSTEKPYHISLSATGYVVKQAGSKTPEVIVETEEEAIDYVRRVSPNSSIRIHDRNGKIRSL